MDTVEADQALGFGEDERRYGVAVDMLRSLDIGRIHLLTNNPLKVDALSAGGIDVVDQDRVFGSVTRQNPTLSQLPRPAVPATCFRNCWASPEPALFRHPTYCDTARPRV